MVTRVVYCRVTRGIVGLPEGLLQGYSGVYCRVTRGVYCRVTRRFIARFKNFFGLRGTQLYKIIID